MARKPMAEPKLKSFEEVNQQLESMAELQRQVELEQSACNESVDQLKAASQDKIKPLIDDMKTRELLIKEYCEHHKASFEKVKTKKLTHGSVSFRQQTTGKASLKEMTDAQLQAVLDRLKTAGFSIKSKTGTNKLADDAQSKLIRHLWLMLFDAGEVRNSSELALAAFVKKQTGVDALQFLSTESADRVINRLRNWCKRAGVERIDLK